MPLKMLRQLIQAYPAFLALIRTPHVRFSAKKPLGPVCALTILLKQHILRKWTSGKGRINRLTLSFPAQTKYNSYINFI